jgi:hypothetical protein
VSWKGQRQSDLRNGSLRAVQHLLRLADNYYRSAERRRELPVGLATGVTEEPREGGAVQRDTSSPVRIAASLWHHSIPLKCYMLL